MRILIASDAWSPQVNGVVRTLQSVIAELEDAGHKVFPLVPEGRRSMPFPLYPEITLTLTSASQIGREIAAIRPDAIHIATEGPLGWAARRACLRRGLPFTTAFHTRFAEYAASRLPLPGVAALGWKILRAFHRPSANVMVPTRTIANDLARRGFSNVQVWTRGANRTLFHSYESSNLDYPRPILLYAGRLAIEKGIADFLALDVPGTKVLVGDGPMRPDLQRRYPQAVFLGYRGDGDYAKTLASADVLVFPGRTDTFGLVMLEAMACGTPVAAYDIPSPVDVVDRGVTGCLDPDLATAIRGALTLDRGAVQRGSEKFNWRRAAELFLNWLAPIPDSAWAEPESREPVLHLR